MTSVQYGLIFIHSIIILILYTLILRLDEMMLAFYS